MTILVRTASWRSLMVNLKKHNTNGRPMLMVMNTYRRRRLLWRTLPMPKQRSRRRHATQANRLLFPKGPIFTRTKSPIFMVTPLKISLLFPSWCWLEIGQDKIGLHRISNPSTEKGAVSLHLYTPPFQSCKTFEEKTGRARSSGNCSFYSVRGRLCNQI